MLWTLKILDSADIGVREYYILWVPNHFQFRVFNPLKKKSLGFDSTTFDVSSCKKVFSSTTQYSNKFKEWFTTIFAWMTDHDSHEKNVVFLCEVNWFSPYLFFDPITHSHSGLNSVKIYLRIFRQKYSMAMP